MTGDDEPAAVGDGGGVRPANGSGGAGHACARAIPGPVWYGLQTEDLHKLARAHVGLGTEAELLPRPGSR
jgi:hypothetical protein